MRRVSSRSGLRSVKSSIAVSICFVAVTACSGLHSTVEFRRDPAGYIIDVADNRTVSEFFRWPNDHAAYLIGHRGGGFLAGYPENALESIRNTARLAPAILEIDVQRTRDGVFVLSHDATLERTTTGAGNIADLDWADLQTLRLVDVFGNETDSGMVSLADALHWGDDRVLFAIDLKADAWDRELAEFLTAAEVEDDVFVFVDDIEQMVTINAINPLLHFALFMTADTLNVQLDAIEAAGIPRERVTSFTAAADTDPAFNAAVHANGMSSLFGAFSPEHDLSQVQAAALYERLIAAGVDGISTNRIEDLARSLGYVPQ